MSNFKVIPVADCGTPLLHPEDGLIFTKDGIFKAQVDSNGNPLGGLIGLLTEKCPRITLTNKEAMQALGFNSTQLREIAEELVLEETMTGSTV